VNDAQIIQDLVEGAQRAGATVQTIKTAKDFHEFNKLAGQVHALVHLGLIDEADLEAGHDLTKTAAWPAILARAGAAAVKYAPKAWQWGKNLVGAGKKAIGTGKDLYGQASQGMQKAWGGMGQRVLGAAERAGVSQKGLGYMKALGKGSGRGMLGMGLMGGGLSAATAKPGESRLGAFAKGFGTGALGGAAWGMGSNAARMGMGRMLGANRMAGLYRAGRHGWFGGGLKGFGAKAALGAGTLGGGMAASSAVPM
jgi:hypothetical protein